MSREDARPFQRCPAPVTSDALGVGQSSGNTPRSIAFTITVSDVMVLRVDPIFVRFICMCASGVLPSSFATGVGHNPDPVPLVRGADGGSWNTVPLRVIPERGKVLKHVPESFRPESRHVLQQDISGSKVPNETGHMRPEPARVVLREALTGEGDGLTGESGSDEIDSRSSFSEKSHIPEVGHVGPVSGEHAAGEGVDLGEPGGLESSGAFESEVDSSDSCKEGADP